MNHPAWCVAIAWVVLAVCPAASLTVAGQGAVEQQHLFFGFGTSKPEDPAVKRQRGKDAVNGVRDRLAGLGYEANVLLDADKKEPDAGGPAPGRVTGADVTNALGALRRRLTTNDTVILYSHTHGVKKRENWPGGMVLDAVAEDARDRRPGLN